VMLKVGQYALATSSCIKTARNTFRVSGDRSLVQTMTELLGEWKQHSVIIVNNLNLRIVDRGTDVLRRRADSAFHSFVRKWYYFQ
ncbi:hypothetical protein L9F63_016808, partial [Diploptera punctata]